MGEVYYTSQLARELAKILGITYKDAMSVFRCSTELIKRKITEGYEVDLYHFGRFKVIDGISTVNRVIKNPHKLGKKTKYKRLVFSPALGFRIPIYTGKQYQAHRRRLTKKGE